MLGGAFGVALLRNGLGAGLMLSVFLLLDRPRFSMKTTVCAYIFFGIFAVVLYSVWYLADVDHFIRYAGPLTVPFLGGFCTLLSGEGIYLSLYKIALGFYFLAVCVFCGVDVARWWFGGNMWVDIAVRICMIAVIVFFLVKKFRGRFLENVDLLREEMDLSGAAILIGSIGLAAILAYWPPIHVFSILNIIRIMIIMFMAGTIQYVIFHLYFHRGKEHSYKAQKQLLEMNEKLLQRQLELAKESEEEAARVRHDVRHHCLLIADYARSGETEELLGYIRQYVRDVEDTRQKRICGNKAVNSILSVYARRARDEKIKVTMDAAVPEGLPVQDIDLVAILANLFENAIHGCIHSGGRERKICLCVMRKGHKLVIRCKNTCAPDVRFDRGLPLSGDGSGVGVSSILKTASHYDGEADFKVENGFFVVRILLNLPERIPD